MENRYLKKLQGKWKIIVSSAVIILITSILLLRYTSTGEFCNICHEMNTPYKTWVATRHGPPNGRMDNCLPCHTSPKFGSILIAKAKGFMNVWNHFTGQYEMDDDIKASLPVYCERPECHPNPEKIEIGPKIKVNHELHINRGYACVVCHDRVGHGKDPAGYNGPEMKNYCFKCHNDETAIQSQCDRCHVYQDEMLKIEGNTSAHWRAELSCTDCHPQCNRATEKICLDCHLPEDMQREKNAQKVLQNKLKEAQAKIANLKILLQEVEPVGPEIIRIQEIYNSVEKSINFIISDGSNGAHNMGYTNILLRSSVIRLDLALRLMNNIINKSNRVNVEEKFKGKS